MASHNCGVEDDFVMRSFCWTIIVATIIFASPQLLIKKNVAELFNIFGASLRLNEELEFFFMRSLLGDMIATGSLC